MRLLFLCLLVYLGYKVFKILSAPGKPQGGPPMGNQVKQVDDVMVKDPWCDTYIPRNDGVKETINGETLYFCSTACRDKYLDKIRQKHE